MTSYMHRHYGKVAGLVVVQTEYLFAVLYLELYVMYLHLRK